jgi:hypothetical protein
MDVAGLPEVLPADSVRLASPELRAPLEQSVSKHLGRPWIEGPAYLSKLTQAVQQYL